MRGRVLEAEAGNWRGRMRIHQQIVCVVALFSILGVAWGQRADRATVTGVVTDQSGNSVANATVKIRNDDTGVETTLTTNAAGAYSSPSLVLGTYTITVEVAGFKTAVQSGIRLVGGQVYRHDATVEIGAVSERVTVTASAEILNTSSPDVTHAVDSTYYNNPPPGFTSAAVPTVTSGSWRWETAP